MEVGRLPQVPKGVEGVPEHPDQQQKDSVLDGGRVRAEPREACERSVFGGDEGADGAGGVRWREAWEMAEQVGLH